MPKGPPVSEIFAQSVKGRNAPFKQDDKTEQISMLSHKKSMAPLPPMKKFGGYKPKILGSSGGDDIVPISYSQNKPTATPLEGSGRSPPPRPLPALTQPRPFVIGDKDTPMTLSVVEVDDIDDNDEDILAGVEDMHIYEEPVVHKSNLQNDGVNDIISTYNHNIIRNNNKNRALSSGSNSFPNNKENPYNTKIENESFTVSNLDEILIDENEMRLSDSTTKIAADNPVFEYSGTEAEDSGVDTQEGVFIPEPDYDEEEQSMMFGEEDPDELKEEETRVREEEQEMENVRQIKAKQRQQQQQKSLEKSELRVYDGEDLSRYLSDDEDDIPVNVKPQVLMRLSQKHSMFKQAPPPQQHKAPATQHNTTGKRKKSGKNKAPVFHSVRNFSYADSKSGTKGRSSGNSNRLSLGDLSRSPEILFGSGNDDGYESFLRSKHGVSAESPSLNNTCIEFPQWKNRDGSILQKLTVRFKGRKSKQLV